MAYWLFHLSLGSNKQIFGEDKEKSNKEMEKEEAAAGDTDIAKEQQRLRKKVTDLMKKQKLRQVRKIVKNQDNSRPWGQDAQAKV